MSTSALSGNSSGLELLGAEADQRGPHAETEAFALLSFITDCIEITALSFQVENVSQKIT